MIEVIKRESIYIWYYLTVLLEQIVPYWALGILIGSAVSVFGKKYIHGTFAKLGTMKLGALGVIPASLLGIASPLCMYGTIPIAASFSEQGVKDDYLAAFMMSSVLLNPQLILYSAALGQTAMAIRVFFCFLCGTLAGVLVRIYFKNKPFFRFSGFHESPGRDTDPNLLMRFIKNVWRNIRATALWFLIGILLTAVYQRYVPGDLVAGLFGKNEGFGVLMAATIGVPLYMCGGGSIPLLMDWLANGMSMGSAAAFMITGPATKITNLGALKTVLGARHFALYILYAMMFSLAAGLLTDLIV